MTLIIVESPTKARTFNAILKGQDYFVFATLGHIRDLPSNKLSVDYTKDFKPDYAIMSRKKKTVDQLKLEAQKHDEIILATDPDREGESISYHAAYILGLMNEKWPEISFKKGGKKVRRIVFHEITKNALVKALEKPEELRLDLVKAQQARRIIDRIVGYELSPLLWKKLGKNWVSAGRVQTVALRFVVEREKEIEAFNKEPYFQIYGIFKNGEEVRGKLISKDGVVYEKKIKLELFAGPYEYTTTSILKDQIEALVSDIQKDSYTVKDFEEKIIKRYPPPPFTTSLLQQDAINRFGFTSKMVMKLAQDLYEQGLITYHRTDSFNLSSAFVFRAKDFIAETYGKEYALEKPRGFRTKSRSAQEAHEAIRPTKVERTPDNALKTKKLSKNHKMIYELVYNRALATQMAEAEVKIITVSIEGKKKYLFQSEYQQVLFDGFLRVLFPEYAKKHSTKPAVKKGDAVTLQNIEPEEKLTQPPYRYTEASLIRTLEERGIGRPSTYAPILSLLQDKSYVEKEGRLLKPSNLGTAICNYLSDAFKELFDINFTAGLEERLDKIAEGSDKLLHVLREFYDPFQLILTAKEKDITPIKVKEETTEVCPKCGKPLEVKMSRFGKFFACSGYPDCKFTKSMLKYVAGKKCPLDSGRIVIRYSKTKKRFYGCENYPECKFVSFSYAQL
ncbi:MAG: type I DNA topoisomerase [Patescibacteria group bacterium]